MTFLLIVCFVVAFAFAAVRAGRTFDAQRQRSFEALTFETPEGRVSGNAVRVVKVVTHENGDYTGPRDLYRYCVAPGPSYFVAMCHVERLHSPARLKWVVRPLTEERMRGALVGDDTALALAFEGVRS